MTLCYLDETGVSLMLGVARTWSKRGAGKQHRISSRWGSQGRLNILGTLSVCGPAETLSLRVLDGNTTRTAVVDYLDTLARTCSPDRLTVVVLDNAAFHKGGELERSRVCWEACGLFLRYLPPYCPFLNRIEMTWRKLKGFLLPRRSYDTLEQLYAALQTAFLRLNAAQL